MGFVSFYIFNNDAGILFTCFTPSLATYDFLGSLTWKLYRQSVLKTILLTTDSSNVRKSVCYKYGNINFSANCSYYCAHQLHLVTAINTCFSNYFCRYKHIEINFHGCKIILNYYCLWHNYLHILRKFRQEFLINWRKSTF